MHNSVLYINCASDRSKETFKVVHNSFEKSGDKKDKNDGKR